MTIKKLTFCILCSVNAANLATDEDFNNENSLNSEVEEDSLINKNDWNTRKWGNIYILFPHLSVFNIVNKLINRYSCIEDLKNPLAIIFNFIASAVVEYKYMFHKSYGLNVKLNLNNLEFCSGYSSFFSLEPSLEWIYGRKGKKIFSGSFSPLGFAYVQCSEGPRAEDFIKNVWTFDFVFLKYEYDRRFYLNFGKIKTTWYNLKNIPGKDFWKDIGLNLVSIEFGLNIIGVNNWRKGVER